MTRTRRPPGRPRSAEADSAILDAALDLLIERGVEAASIEQVARRAGVTRATVYRRYPDRTQLLVAAIQAAHQAPDPLPEPRDVEQLLSWWAQALATPGRRRLLRRHTFSLHDHPDLYEAYWNASIKPREQWIRTTLEQAKARGQFPPEADLGIVQQILTGAITTHLLTHPDTSTAQETEAFLLAVLRETRYRSNP